MAKTKNVFKTKSGKDVVLDLKTEQKNFCPGKYVYIYADLYADICEAKGLTEIETKVIEEELVKVICEKFNLNPLDYSIDRTPGVRIRNLSSDSVSKAKFSALFNAQERKAELIKTDKSKSNKDDIINIYDVLIAKQESVLNRLITKDELKASIERQLIAKKINKEQYNTLISHYFQASEVVNTIQDLSF